MTPFQVAFFRQQRRGTRALEAIGTAFLKIQFLLFAGHVSYLGPRRESRSHSTELLLPCVDFSAHHSSLQVRSPLSHGSRVRSHGSRVRPHGSRVRSHGSRVRSHGSRVRTQPMMISATPNKSQPRTFLRRPHPGSAVRCPP